MAVSVSNSVTGRPLGAYMSIYMKFHLISIQVEQFDKRVPRNVTVSPGSSPAGVQHSSKRRLGALMA
jgi:hypothetical protein